jgi:hypothetical protein
MAEYLILIYGQEKEYSPAETQEMMGLHDNFSKQVEVLGGRIVGGEALQPTATATTIRGDVVTDGPFVETKEALGGYYVVEAADLDQALKIGKACPAPNGGVEVRPIMKFE